MNFAIINLDAISETVRDLILNNTIMKWIPIDRELPPEDEKVLFKFIRFYNGKKYIKKVVGYRTEIVYIDNTTESNYFCVTTSGNKKTLVVPDEWIPLPD